MVVVVSVSMITRAAPAPGISLGERLSAWVPSCIVPMKRLRTRVWSWRSGGYWLWIQVCVMGSWRNDSGWWSVKRVDFSEVLF